MLTTAPSINRTRHVTPPSTVRCLSITCFPNRFTCSAYLAPSPQVLMGTLRPHTMPGFMHARAFISRVPKGNHVTLSPSDHVSHASVTPVALYDPYLRVVTPTEVVNQFNGRVSPGFFTCTGGPSRNRLRICFLGPRQVHFPRSWDIDSRTEACSFPTIQRIFPLRLVLPRHRCGHTAYRSTRPTH